MKKVISKVVIVASIVAIGISIANGWKMPTEWSEYAVRSGDTVCGIAIRITPNDKDYRKTEYYIEEKNNIEKAMIYPGQTILIPVYE